MNLIAKVSRFVQFRKNRFIPTLTKINGYKLFHQGRILDFDHSRGNSNVFFLKFYGFKIDVLSQIGVKAVIMVPPSLKFTTLQN